MACTDPLVEANTASLRGRLSSMPQRLALRFTLPTPRSSASADGGTLPLKAFGKDAAFVTNPPESCRSISGHDRLYGSAPMTFT